MSFKLNLLWAWIFICLLLNWVEAETSELVWFPGHLNQKFHMLKCKVYSFMSVTGINNVSVWFYSIHTDNNGYVIKPCSALRWCHWHLSLTSRGKTQATPLGMTGCHGTWFPARYFHNTCPAPVRKCWHHMLWMVSDYLLPLWLSALCFCEQDYIKSEAQICTKLVGGLGHWAREEQVQSLSLKETVW